METIIKEWLKHPLTENELKIALAGSLVVGILGIVIKNESRYWSLWEIVGILLISIGFGSVLVALYGLWNM